MPLFPAPLCPMSTLSVVLWFDICVYLVTVCSVGSRTDRVGLNKERKLGNGSAHAHTNTEILEHKLQWPCCYRCALYVQNFLTCLNLACSWGHKATKQLICLLSWFTLPVNINGVNLCRYDCVLLEFNSFLIKWHLNYIACRLNIACYWNVLISLYRKHTDNVIW